MSKSIFLCSVLMIGLEACGSVDPPGRSGQFVIAVVPKGTTHLFWRSIEAGAREAAADLGIEVIWKGPLKENDRAQQIAVVEQLVTQKVAGIVLAPLDDTALLRPVRAAQSRGIPVLIFDTGLKGEVGRDFVSFVATDNRAAGRLAARHMTEILGGSGKVGVLRYQVGSDSTTEREEGFLELIRDESGLDLILENQYGGVTVGETIRKSEEILDLLGDVDGIFCPTEPTTNGLLVTLRKHHLVRKLRLIGFDSSDELIRSLRLGEVDALVLQEPHRMAYLAVETLVRHLRGESVESRINTRVRLITAENLDEPEVKRMLGLN